jgi:hypothetical protein
MVGRNCRTTHPQYSTQIISAETIPRGNGNDIQLLIDQVNKLAMLQVKKLFMSYHKNLKLMDNLKLKSQ